MNNKLKPLNLSGGIAVSDNKLVNACYRMSSIQKRLFNMAVASCHSQNFLDSGEVIVSIDDFAYLSGKSVKESLRLCRDESRKMSKIQVIDIIYKEKRNRGKIREMIAADRRENSDREIDRISYKNFFQEVAFVDMEGKRQMYFKFSDWLIPYVEIIKKKFAQVPLVEVSKLGSFYSLRLFDFLMATKPIGDNRKRVFSYQEFREILGFVDDKKNMYSAWCDFRKRCLTTPVIELNKKTNYDWSYKVTGRGDSARKITITAKERNQMNLNLER